MHSTSFGWRTPVVVVLAAACLIAMLGFGTRGLYGFFLEPMTTARGWNRETFGFALALQNLVWGIMTPIAGALAEKYGQPRVLGFGAIVAAFGLWSMTVVTDESMLYLAAGVIEGVGVGLTSFSLAMAAMAKVVRPERRSLALGVCACFGSIGQMVFSPLSVTLIQTWGWESAMVILACVTLGMLPLALLLPSGKAAELEEGTVQLSLRDALNEAFAHRGYLLLNAGFFVCGFQIAFMMVHFPAYVTDIGFAPQVGAYSLALIGLANIAGTIIAGFAGQKFSKKSTLSVLYLGRGLWIIALVTLPMSVSLMYALAVIMGLLWLAVVPLTTGIVGQIFGVRYMATLSGIVMFTHQLGSFVGVWLGGWAYDQTGSYDLVWYLAIVLSFTAAAVHWPIDERPVARLQEAQGAI